ncbi:uncharacterized protein LOC118750444 [Rhagoletis pomonella]|uniref:uncharacterized protein LOC118750444 n=1 Tax=Rhagoletis pomonella TaxID=28610 RepID=UPI00177A98F8|nr:uncharacterized protein LOC118750444 [Rhagoletis pomonella]
MYLPLLKPANIIEAYSILKQDAMDVKFVNASNNTESFFKPFINYFERQWMKKEKPVNFSVYKEPVRTSNSAEGFHSRLNMKLPKRGTFYNFLETLFELDFVKSMDYSKSISGCTNLYKSKPFGNKVRDKFIKKRLDLLKNNKISLMEILSQFSKMENCILAEKFVNEIHSSDDDYEDDDDSNEDQHCTDHIQTQQNMTLLCVICCERERELLFDPCHHYKVCQTCFQKMEENSKLKGVQTLCPICRSIIKEAKQIFC